MQYVRFRIDGAVPKADYDALPAATKTAIRDKLRQLRTFCRKINEGMGNEEATVNFKWHVCNHEIGLPCEPENEI